VSVNVPVKVPLYWPSQVPERPPPVGAVVLVAVVAAAGVVGVGAVVAGVLLAAAGAAVVVVGVLDELLLPQPSTVSASKPESPAVTSRRAGARKPVALCSRPPIPANRRRMTPIRGR
jgi:hypothetical protein